MREGERLLDQLACRRCHISAGRGNRLSVSLDVSASRKTAKELALSIRRPVTNMPNFGLEEGQITTLVNVIYAGSQGRQSADSAPVRVHFTANGTKSGDIFTAKCGSCHRILSERLGAVGNGDVGPNLSGLFSKYYPQTFRNGARWTDSNLRIWLKNSRDIRPQARMLPVILTKSETKELESVIRLSTDLTR